MAESTETTDPQPLTDADKRRMLELSVGIKYHQYILELIPDISDTRNFILVAAEVCKRYGIQPSEFKTMSMPDRVSLLKSLVGIDGATETPHDKDSIKASNNAQLAEIEVAKAAEDGQATELIGIQSANTHVDGDTDAVNSETTVAVEDPPPFLDLIVDNEAKTINRKGYDSHCKVDLSTKLELWGLFIDLFEAGGDGRNRSTFVDHGDPLNTRAHRLRQELLTLDVSTTKGQGTLLLISTSEIQEPFTA